MPSYLRYAHKKCITSQVCSKMQSQSSQRAWNTCSSQRNQILEGLCFGCCAIPCLKAEVLVGEEKLPEELNSFLSTHSQQGEFSNSHPRSSNLRASKE